MNPRDLIDAINALPALHTEAYERAGLRERRGLAGDSVDYRDFVAQEEAKLLQEYAQRGQMFVTEIFEEIKLPGGRTELAPPVKCRSCRRPYMRGYVRIADPQSGRELEVSYEALHAIERSHKNADQTLIGQLEEILDKELSARTRI